MAKVTGWLAPAALAGLGLAVAALHPGAAPATTFDAQAGVQILAPLGATMTAELRFGHLGPGDGGGTVIVTTGGLRFATGTVRLLEPASHGPAVFAVSGQPGAAYRIGLPATITARHDSGQPKPGVTVLSVTNLKSFSANAGAETDTGQLGGGGSDTVRVGGTLVVPPTAKTGVYTAALSLTLTYE